MSLSRRFRKFAIMATVVKEHTVGVVRLDQYKKLVIIHFSLGCCGLSHQSPYSTRSVCVLSRCWKFVRHKSKSGFICVV